MLRPMTNLAGQVAVPAETGVPVGTVGDVRGMLRFCAAISADIPAELLIACPGTGPIVVCFTTQVSSAAVFASANFHAGENMSFFSLDSAALIALIPMQLVVVCPVPEVKNLASHSGSTAIPASAHVHAGKAMLVFGVTIHLTAAGTSPPMVNVIIAPVIPAVAGTFFDHRFHYTASTAFHHADAILNAVARGIVEPFSPQMSDLTGLFTPLTFGRKLITAQKIMRNVHVFKAAIFADKPTILLVVLPVSPSVE